VRVDASRVREEQPLPQQQQLQQAGVGPGAGGQQNDGGGEGAQQGPGGGQGVAQDSLSMMQLKKLVGEGGRYVVSLCGYFPSWQGMWVEPFVCCEGRRHRD